MARKTAARPRARYILEILGQRIPVHGWAEASNAVSVIRERTGAGASEMGVEFPLLEEGEIVAYVSYNGKVWKGQPGDWPAVILLYDPDA